MDSWKNDHRRSLMPSIGVPQLKLVRGHGSRVWDSEGREYVDLLAGIAVNSLGHAHPDLVRAVSSQMLTLGHISNYFASDPQIRLAQRLLALTGAVDGGVYFSNSGAEANEAALKIARRVGSDEHPGRNKVIAVEGGFHGRTLGALSLTHKPAYREPFEPLIPQIVHVPFGDIEALRTAVDDSTAAVFIETIQGEAGVRPHPEGYLRAVREATSAVDALLVLDEVQTGIGRTGTWLGYLDEELGEGITPDVVTLAKGLGGGFPLAATVTLNERATQLLKPGEHGSTYSGNPVATSAGLAVLDVIERDGLLGHVRQMGDRLAAGLRQCEGVTEVRGAGLLLAFGLADTAAADFMRAALEHGFIVNAVTAQHIRIAPPLIVTDSELDSFMDAVPDIRATAAQAATAQAQTN